MSAADDYSSLTEDEFVDRIIQDYVELFTLFGQGYDDFDSMLALYKSPEFRQEAKELILNVRAASSGFISNSGPRNLAEEVSSVTGILRTAYGEPREMTEQERIANVLGCNLFKGIAELQREDAARSFGAELLKFANGDAETVEKYDGKVFNVTLSYGGKPH